MPSGDISVNMIGNNRLSPAANAAAGSLDRLGRSVVASAGQSSRLSRGILELSRGFEDFAVAGPRGAINNLSQFATIAGGPVAGAIAGVGSALLIMGTNLLSASENTDTMADSVSRLNDELSNLKGTLERGAEFRALRGETDALRAGGGGLGIGELLDLEGKNKGRIGDLSGQRDALGFEADSIQAEINRRRQSIRNQLENPTGIGGALGGLVGITPDVRQEQEELRKLEERLLEVLDKQLHTRRQIGELETQQGLIPGLKDAAQIEEARKFQEQFDQFQIEEERRRIANAQKEFSEGERAIRQQLGLDAEGNFTGRRSIGNAGPATLQAGSADAFRFINSARAGQVNRSIEAKELMDANRKLEQMLQELRKQTAQTNNVPEEVVDF